MHTYDVVIDYYSTDGFLHLLAGKDEQCSESLSGNYAKWQ